MAAATVAAGRSGRELERPVTVVGVFLDDGERSLGTELAVDDGRLMYCMYNPVCSVSFRPVKKRITVCTCKN